MHSLLSYLLGYTFWPDVAFWIVLIADIVSVATIPSVLIQRHGRPLAALSWILTLMIVPVGGVLAWWLLGRTHLRRKTRARQVAAMRLDDGCPNPVRQPTKLPDKLSNILPFALKDRRWTEGVFSPAMATDICMLEDGGAAYAEMEEAIVNAKSEIRVLFYIWQVDPTGERFAARLTERARAGVKVRVLVDAMGSRRFLRRLAKGLREAGVEVVGFLPSRLSLLAPTFNLRNHRKLLLVDGAVAFTGGMNLGREYEHDWHDFMIRLEGAVVRNLDDVFREDWNFARGEALDEMNREGLACSVQPSGLCVVIASGPDRMENRIHDAFFLAISGARQRLWLTSPYFIPSSAIVAALRGAAQRGVDVRILTPRLNDIALVALASRSYYSNLVSEGVRVFEYLPRFLHAKSLVVDDELAFVGSANVDTRSFRLNFELGCFVLARELNTSLGALFERDLKDSIEIRGDELERKSAGLVCLESAAHLLSPLL